jgi:hypothetical protein
MNADGAVACRERRTLHVRPERDHYSLYLRLRLREGDTVEAAAAHLAQRRGTGGGATACNRNATFAVVYMCSMEMVELTIKRGRLRRNNSLPACPMMARKRPGGRLTSRAAVWHAGWSFT